VTPFQEFRRNRTARHRSGTCASTDADRKMFAAQKAGTAANDSERERADPTLSMFGNGKPSGHDSVHSAMVCVARDPVFQFISTTLLASLPGPAGGQGSPRNLHWAAEKIGIRQCCGLGALSSRWVWVVDESVYAYSVVTRLVRRQCIAAAGPRIRVWPGTGLFASGSASHAMFQVLSTDQRSLPGCMDPRRSPQAQSQQNHRKGSPWARLHSTCFLRSLRHDTQGSHLLSARV
jgi:hypothetical protein